MRVEVYPPRRPMWLVVMRLRDVRFENTFSWAWRPKR